jgi:hypothetical protein
MKSHRFKLLLILLSLATAAFAQSEPQKSNSPKSDAQKSFDTMKTLAGSWQGQVTMNPPIHDMSMAQTDVTLRVTSRGNAMVHEMKEAGITDDPTKYDHPVTLFYLDNDRLLLTHYCDAGNRPRMTARTSPGGKTVEFDFVDVSGPTDHGHMQHAVFTIIDANHHIEDWTYLMPGDKPVHAHMELQRAAATVAAK